MDNDMVRILLEIQEDIATTKTMVEGLSGPDGRIKKLENDQTRQWWMTVCVIPALAVAHGIARKLGVQV